MIRLLAGDCRDVLATLPAESVHCVVTSPPYFALRDYNTGTWEGGDPSCDHTGSRRNHGDEKQATSAGTSRDPVSHNCRRCGATRVDRQIGLEKSPADYLETMVSVFREVRRVLRSDGTVWLNIGDSYNNRTKVRTSSHQPSLNNFVDDNWAERAARGGVRMSINDGAVKEKDLLMMPARLALALQADGWWVRSDIIWHKPNPMPESVTDRPTSAHEHVFLLAKSAKYFFDSVAVREDAEYGYREHTGEMRSVAQDGRRHTTGTTKGGDPSAGRNLRNVWTIATYAYSQAHFATFPPELAERCIRAGTSERGCCAACGAPWVRQTDTAYHQNRTGKTGRKDVTGSNGWDDRTYLNLSKISTTTGWSASCTCRVLYHEGAGRGEVGTRPCVVLDPFAGAGTSLLVADRLQRDAIGIELNPDYTRMAMDRCQDDAPLFAAFPVVDPAEVRQAELWSEPLAAD